MAISVPCSMFPALERGQIDEAKINATKINETKCGTICVSGDSLFGLRRNCSGNQQYGASAAQGYIAGSRAVGAQAQPRYPHRWIYSRRKRAREADREEFVFSIDPK